MGAAGASTFNAKVSHSIRDSRQLQASANCKANKKIKAQPQTGVQKCKGKRCSLATVSRLVPAIMMTAVGWLREYQRRFESSAKDKNKMWNESSTFGKLDVIRCC